MSEPYDVSTEADRRLGLRRLIDRTGHEWTEPDLSAAPAIVVTRRSCDYHACIEGRPQVWGCGTTWAEAIGSLVYSHPERFGLRIVDGGRER